MNKKRIRQMDLALRRRLSDRPAADYFAPGDALLRTLESEGYLQRFTGLFNGARLRCADVLALIYQVRTRVLSETGVELEPEIKYLH